MSHGTSFLAALVVAAGAFAAGVSCETISTADSPTTGSGGMATTGTMSGGAGGAGGSATACPSSKPACMAPTDCPPTQNECVDATCVGGCCGTSDLAAMTPTASQTPGDCMQVVCDGMGGTLTIEDDTDADDDMNPCTADTCSMGVPVHAPIAGPCTTNGGMVCGDPSGMNAGQCIQCNVGSDCSSGTCLANGACM